MVTHENPDRQDSLDDSLGARTLESGLSMLFLAQRQSGKFTVEDCRNVLGLSRSTVYRILRVLRRHDLVIPTRDRKAYRLGPAILRLSEIARRAEALRPSARLFLERLTARTAETAILMALDWPSAVCLDRIESSQMIRLAYSVGSYLPLHAGAGPKAILAFQPFSRIEAYLHQPVLAPVTRAGSPVNAAQFRRELEEVRSTGYAESLDEVDEGTAAIAAPVFGGDGYAMASLSVAGPSFRFDRKRAQLEVVWAASTLTSSLGGRMPGTR